MFISKCSGGVPKKNCQVPRSRVDAVGVNLAVNYAVVAMLRTSQVRVVDLLHPTDQLVVNVPGRAQPGFDGHRAAQPAAGCRKPRRVRRGLPAQPQVHPGARHRRDDREGAAGGEQGDVGLARLDGHFPPSWSSRASTAS